jgi:hypothetical protein
LLPPRCSSMPLTHATAVTSPPTAAPTGQLSVGVLLPLRRGDGGKAVQSPPHQPWCTRQRPLFGQEQSPDIPPFVVCRRGNHDGVIHAGRDYVAPGDDNGVDLIGVPVAMELLAQPCVRHNTLGWGWGCLPDSHRRSVYAVHLQRPHIAR